MSDALVWMLAALAITTVMGFPVGFSLFGSGILYFILVGQDPSLAGELILHGLFASFMLLAVPLFVLAARLMNDGGITERLLQLCLVIVGRRRGGLAQVNVLTALVFSSMSGSATADAAGVGRMLIRMMTGGGYSRGFAAAVTSASATIGPIFPPSILMVLYALASSTSVGGLFMAGVLPGILMAIMMMLLVAWIARRRNYPTIERPPTAEILRIVRRSILPLLMPVIMLGGIYTGVFTPTEAAAVACAYALVLGVLIYRMLGFKDVVEALVDSARITATVACVFFGAFVFSYILTVERIPAAIAVFLNHMDITANMFLFVVNILFLLLASVMDEAAMILVVIPLLMPTVQTLGIDPIHFGLVVVFNATIGLITPPYGMVLFVVSGVNKIPVREILAEIWPFIGILLVTLVIVTYVPWLSLALPTYFGFVR
jgi:tripartite ATP-independent transporter DctM subunit